MELESAGNLCRKYRDMTSGSTTSTWSLKLILDGFVANEYHLNGIFERNMSFKLDREMFEWDHYSFRGRCPASDDACFNHGYYSANLMDEIWLDQCYFLKWRWVGIMLENHLDLVFSQWRTVLKHPPPPEYEWKSKNKCFFSEKLQNSDPVSNP